MQELAAFALLSTEIRWLASPRRHIGRVDIGIVADEWGAEKSASSSQPIYVLKRHHGSGKRPLYFRDPDEGVLECL